MIEQPTVMGMKVGWSQKMVDDFKELLFKKNEIRILRDLRDKQATIINKQLDEIHSNQDEIDRLRSIDRALANFIFERDSAARDEFAREGLKETIAERQLGRKFKS